MLHRKPDKKATCHMIPFISNAQINKSLEEEVVSSDKVAGEWIVIANGYWVPFLYSNKNVLKVFNGNNYATLWIF